jgi:hypothetical protein
VLLVLVLVFFAGEVQDLTIRRQAWRVVLVEQIFIGSDGRIVQRSNRRGDWDRGYSVSTSRDVAAAALAVLGIVREVVEFYLNDFPA